jgi:hypothetical protein
MSHGCKSTLDVFGDKKSTLYDRRKLFIFSKKNINSLVLKSTGPNNIRRMTVNSKFIKFIGPAREEYGNVGKYKLKMFIDEYVRQIGVKTIQEDLLTKICPY